MGVKKVSMNGKGSYAVYQNTGAFAKNKKKNLTRHIKENPNDASAVAALGAASSARPRKAPIRLKARLDSWCVPDGDGNYTHNRSMNMLSGRLSAHGKFLQEAAAFSKKCANRLLNDPNKVLHLHTTARSLSDVCRGWSGWEDFVNGKPTNSAVKSHKKKKKNKSQTK